MKKITILTITFFLAHFTLLTSSQAKADCIAVIPAGWQQEFWHHVVQGAREAGRDFNVEIRYRAPSKEGSTSAQKRIVHAFKDKGCKGFIIAPIDASLNNEVATLLDSGIPTVYVDRGTDGKDQTKAIVSTDNYAAGYFAGQALSARLGGTGTVAILRVQKGVVTTDAREQGFVDAVIEAGLDIQVDEYLGVTAGDAIRTSGKIIDRLQKVDGLFTPNEATTEGVLVSLGKDLSTLRPVHIGFDLNEVIAEGINNGLLHGTVIQDPFGMGYRSVEALVKILKNTKTTKQITTPVQMVTKENLTAHTGK